MDNPWTCWRCGPATPRTSDSSRRPGPGCGACDWTGVDLGRSDANRSRDKLRAFLDECTRTIEEATREAAARRAEVDDLLRRALDAANRLRHEGLHGHADRFVELMKDGVR